MNNSGSIRRAARGHKHNFNSAHRTKKTTYRSCCFTPTPGSRQFAERAHFAEHANAAGRFISGSALGARTEGSDGVRSSWEYTPLIQWAPRRRIANRRFDCGSLPGATMTGRCGSAAVRGRTPARALSRVLRERDTPIDRPARRRVSARQNAPLLIAPPPVQSEHDHGRTAPHDGRPHQRCEG